MSADLDRERIESAKRAAGVIGRSFCIQNNILPINYINDTVIAGHPTAEPHIVRRLRTHTRKNVQLHKVQPYTIKAGLDHLFGPVAPTSESYIKQLWNEVVLRAMNMHAANILIEPTRDAGRIRLDIDGDSDTYWPISHDIFQRLVTFIASSNIGNFAPTKGQRGKATLEIDGRIVDLRISTFPVWHPDANRTDVKIVLRMLRRISSLPALDTLGLDPDQCAMLSRLIAAPRCCLVNGAPTGQGKSTLMYALLRLLDLEHLNVYAIEDPPELYVEQISQSAINVDADWTFHSALVEILRQDPKFVFVGECLDAETARLTLDAGITGIPNATTLHAVDAIGVFERLHSLQAPISLIAKALTATISQRLLKCLCPTCRQPAAPSQALIAMASKFGATFRSTIPIYRRNPQGCDDCFNRGTIGRTAVAEILPISTEIRQALRAGKDDADLATIARDQGYVPMFERALVLLCEGRIDEIELFRRIEPPQIQFKGHPSTHPFTQRLMLALTSASHTNPPPPPQPTQSRPFPAPYPPQRPTNPEAAA